MSEDRNHSIFPLKENDKVLLDVLIRNNLEPIQKSLNECLQLNKQLRRDANIIIGVILFLLPYCFTITGFGVTQILKMRDSITDQQHRINYLERQLEK